MRWAPFGNEDGATAVEYGIMAALLAIAVLVSVSVLGDPVQGLFSGIRGHYDDVNSQF